MKKKAVVFFFFFVLGTNKLLALDWHYYTIQKGDSLLKIARQYDLSTGEISFWNNISNPNKIQVGQTLRLLRIEPTPQTILRLNEKDILSTWKGQVQFSLPLSRWSVHSSYRNYGDSKNYGIWLNALESDIVKASATGKISEVGYLRGYGTFILVDHQNGWLSMYSNLKTVQVQVGQKVKQGDNLAKCKEQKLFFLTSYKGKPVNPQEVLQR